MTVLNLEALSAETREKLLEAVKKSLAGPPIEKAITVSTGLVGVSLETPAQQSAPLMAPFRQRIGRRVGAGADNVTWKQITAVLQNAKFSTTETAAANAIATTVVPKSAVFKEVGTRGSVTRKAIAHGQGYDDVRARETTNTMLLALKLEEQCIIGGNITALGAPAAPTVAVIATDGTIAADAAGWDVRIVALTLMAANRCSMDRPSGYASLAAPFTLDCVLAGNGRAGVEQNVATDGWSAQGALTTSAATVGGTSCLRISWTSIPGASAYAVYAITHGAGAGVPILEAIVSQCQVTLISAAGTGHAIVAGDTSADAAIFDGMIPLIVANTAAYKLNVGGPLTATNSRINQISAMFQRIWDSGKIDEFELLMGGTVAESINALLSATGGGPTILVGPGPAEAGRLDVMFGYHVGWIVNGVTGKRCRVNVLPWMPGGMIIFMPATIPYPKAGFSVPFEMGTSYGWEQIDYAKTVSGGPVDEFDVREEAVLKDYFPAGCGILHNIYYK
jgi:hypothetical protein